MRTTLSLVILVAFCVVLCATLSQGQDVQDQTTSGAKTEEPEPRIAVPPHEAHGETKLFRLTNAQAPEMVKTLQDLFQTENGRNLRIASHAASNSVLVQGGSEHLERVAAIIAELEKAEQPEANGETKLFRLKNAQAAEMVKTLQDLLQTANGNALRIASHGTSNSVLVQGSSDQLERVAAIIAELEKAEQPEAKGETKLFRLQNVKAAEIVKTLQDLLQTANGNALRIASHGTSNSVLVQGSSDQLERVAAIIAELEKAEQPEAKGETKLFRLQNVKAAEIVKTLQDLFQTAEGNAPRIASHDTSNSVLGQGSSDQLQVVEAVIATLDESIDPLD